MPSCERTVPSTRTVVITSPALPGGKCSTLPVSFFSVINGENGSRRGPADSGFAAGPAVLSGAGAVFPAGALWAGFLAGALADCGGLLIPKRAAAKYREIARTDATFAYIFVSFISQHLDVVPGAPRKPESPEP